MPAMGRPSTLVNSSPTRIELGLEVQQGRGLPPDHLHRGIAGHALGPGVEDRDQAVPVRGDDRYLGRPIENAFQAGVRLGQRLFRPLPLDSQRDLVGDGFQCRDRRIGKWLPGKQGHDPAQLVSQDERVPRDKRPSPPCGPIPDRGRRGSPMT